MDKLDRSEWLPRILKDVVWTPSEKQFQASNEKCESADQLTLRDAVEERFRESTLGIFLYHLNSVQLQQLSVQEDKLEMVLYDLAQKTESAREFQRRNDICEDVIGVIKESLVNNPTGKMDIRNVLKRLPVLRLAASNIATMDNCLSHLAGLRALILGGNCLEDFPGKYLPRGLNYLDLFCNRFSDLSQLLVDPPPNLLYIGLSRNHISDSFQYLSRLSNLCYLDLEDNNIGNLEKFIMILSQLSSIISLVLQGNPCSMCIDYKSAIASSSPHLLFLDGVQITEEDKEFEDIREFQLSGALQVFGIRIIGIPKPATEKFNKKKVKHTFHLELECPLLDSKLKTWEPKEDAIQEPDEPTAEKNIKESKKLKTKGDAKVGKKNMKNITSKSSASSNKKNSKNPKKGKKLLSQKVSESENIFNRMIAEDQVIRGTCPFQSGSIEWGNIIQFPEPSIEIPVECVDLDLLRNVFRTTITVRLYHMKTVPPDKKKTKPKPKGKQKGILPSKTKDETEQQTDETPKEFIVSKTLLAKINVPLHSICWNLKSLDYTWSKKNPLQAKPSPDVRLLQYAMKKSKKGKSAKHKKMNDEDIQEIPLPTVLTCHIGIGVKHST